MSTVLAPPILPTEIYAVFCGGIDQATAQKITSSLTGAILGKVHHVHAIFQTAGGFIGDGVFLYNLFRSIPIELTLYNVGQISSAGVVAYLGAKRRKTTRNATFMLHRCINNSPVPTAEGLVHTAQALVLDDERAESIMRSHIDLPPSLWEEFKRQNVYLSGEDAMEYGLADEIGEFSPPPGSQLFNLFG